MSNMKDIFKRNIPPALRNNDLIEQYAEAVGEVFEEIRQDINYKAFENDYAQAKHETLQDVISNYGLRLSPLLKQHVIRRVIRDAPLVFTRLGARESLTWALKTVGFHSFDIDEVWVPNPDLIRRGYYRKLGEDEPRRYDVKPRSYTDFVVGTEYVTEKGTFFRGYPYTDFEKESEIIDIPIYGETYRRYMEQSFKDMVSKTPYMLVRAYDPPAYDEVITDIDPNTGEPAHISDQEKVRIVTETIRYLIQVLQRTATTKVILVTDLLIFDDVIPRILDPIEFEFTHTDLGMGEDSIPDVSDSFYIKGFGEAVDFHDYAPEMLDELLTNTTAEGVDDVDSIHSISDSESATGKGSTSGFDYSTIGNKRQIGMESPYLAVGSYIRVGSIGVIDDASHTIDYSIRGKDFTMNVVNPKSGYEQVLFLDFGATVDFRAPAGVDVTVESMANYHRSQERTAVTTVNGGSNFSQKFDGVHALILRFNESFDEKVQVSVTY